MSGPSQILWIIVHCLAALVFYRRNIGILSFCSIIKHIDFFVLCGECSEHWCTLGKPYWDYLYSLPAELKQKITIDLVLARTHNDVASSSRVNKRLSNRTVTQIVWDYREFVKCGIFGKTMSRPLPSTSDDLDDVLKPRYVFQEESELSEESTNNIESMSYILRPHGDRNIVPGTE